MNGPFRVDTAGVRLRLTDPELEVLRSVPRLLATEGDAGGRLDYSAHPGDPEADRRYRDLVGNDLDRLRAEDRTVFDRMLRGEAVTPEEAEAFMRVIGEGRLALAARLGIEADGWEDGLAATTDPEMAMLGWLGYLQDAMVGVLSDEL